MQAEDRLTNQLYISRPYLSKTTNYAFACLALLGLTIFVFFAALSVLYFHHGATYHFALFVIAAGFVIYIWVLQASVNSGQRKKYELELDAKKISLVTCTNARGQIKLETLIWKDIKNAEWCLQSGREILFLLGKEGDLAIPLWAYSLPEQQAIVGALIRQKIPLVRLLHKRRLPDKIMRVSNYESKKN